MVAPIRLTTTSWLVRGWPFQLVEMAENSLCSTFICTYRGKTVVGERCTGERRAETNRPTSQSQGGLPAPPVYRTPWAGDPRVNIQDDHGMAKPYQVRQVLAAIEKLEEEP